MKVKLRRIPITADRKQKIIQEYRDNVKIDEIVKNNNIGKSTLYRIIKNA